MIKRIEKYSASWCQPCRVLEKTLENIPSDIELIKYDIDEDESIAEMRGIRNIPVLIYYDENYNEVTRTVGAIPLSKIMEVINNYS